jgi:hypothetical protein
MQTIESLEAEFLPYRNAFGFVSDNNGNRSHNPLFHGFYVALLDRYKLLNHEEIKKQKDLLQQLIHPKYPGILLSAPHYLPNTNEHSHDNLKAMFWLSSCLDMNFAANFLEHGRTHDWNWNAEQPDKPDLKGYYGRFGGMIAQAQIAAGEDPSCFSKTWLNGELMLSANAKRGRVEKILLPYFMCKTIRGSGVVANRAVRYWKKKALQKYPGGIGEVFDSWGPAWGGHPYLDHFWGVIDV